jgi:beta-1,2-mannobiose phosphorylase / 1,2-beta-oligomannan phosphorylase
MNTAFIANIIALLFSFFVIGAVLGIAFSKPIRKKLAKLLHLEKRIKRFKKFLLLHRSAHNPIMRPGTTPWTAEAVMNPAAAVIGNRTHLIYRAIGSDGVSRLGYASSPDGIKFDQRLPYPAYVAQKPRSLPGHVQRYSPVLYPSGGSWGGCEDPRMVLIEGRVYVTFNLFDGWDYIRAAAISISEDDFMKQRFWKWDGPHVLSPPNQIHKNWVMFPEKINGKYAILHSVVPKVEIAYRDSIEDVGITEPFIQSWVGPRGSLPAREDMWDSFIRGAATPPIRTDRGWLLLYHAIDNREPGRYKLGAMILDLADPTTVLYRSIVPILSPDATYENDGKPGIVYACGAVVRNGTLYVYYGGADKVVCVATTNLDTFVDAIIQGDQPLLDEGTTEAP